MKKKKDFYSNWVNYQSLDFAKKLAQDSARKTSRYLVKKGFKELSETRGESAFVWKQNKTYMASVLECLGTKNIVADETAKVTGKSYYDVIAHDTVAAAVNDLVALGAQPLVIHAFWGLWKDDWLKHDTRIKSFVKGWEAACRIAEVTWGGGETPSLTKVILRNLVVLSASVVGIFDNKKDILLGKNLRVSDAIIFLKSTGINANGISLTRAIAKKLPEHYATKLPSGKIYGEVILNRTNIYAKLVHDLLKSVNVHYISNITGHGLRKVMRANHEFTYVINKIFEPQEIFNFIQEHTNIDDEEMYGTFNMGQDYAIFLPKRDVNKALEIIRKNKFKGLNAGYIEKGPRQVIIKPKNIIFKGNTLDLR